MPAWSPHHLVLVHARSGQCGCSGDPVNGWIQPGQQLKERHPGSLQADHHGAAVVAAGGAPSVVCVARQHGAITLEGDWHAWCMANCVRGRSQAWGLWRCSAGACGLGRLGCTCSFVSCLLGGFQLPAHVVVVCWSPITLGQHLKWCCCARTRWTARAWRLQLSQKLGAGGIRSLEVCGCGCAAQAGGCDWAVDAAGMCLHSRPECPSSPLPSWAHTSPRRSCAGATGQQLWLSNRKATGIVEDCTLKRVCPGPSCPGRVATWLTVGACACLMNARAWADHRRCAAGAASCCAE